MSILITGGAGFIGCRLGTRLVAAGHDIHAVDNFHPQVHAGRGLPAEFDEAVVLHPGDVTSRPFWDALLRVLRPETLIHLAAETGTGQSLTEASRHAGVNVVGTTTMLDALIAADIRPNHIVLASSRAVYGEGQWATANGEVITPTPRTAEALSRGSWDPVHSDGSILRALPNVAGVTPPRPSNVYAATKLAQEHILEAWCAAMSVSLSILRLQNVYGPGQSLTNSYTGVLTLFARTALEGGVIDVYEDGEIIRDFVHVDDIASALCSAASITPSHGQRLLDLGSGVATTIREAAFAIARLANGPEPVISGKYRAGDVRAAFCDIAAAQFDFGYSPQHTFEDGLGSMLERIRTTGALASTD